MNNKPFTSTTTTTDSKNKKKRKHVSFVEPPPPATAHHEERMRDAAANANTKALKDELIALKREFEQALRMEQCAIDLRQRLFGSRIVSRTDVGDLETNVKSLKLMFPCGVGSMAVVVDDREDVWANGNINSNDNDKETTTDNYATATPHHQGEPPDNLLLWKPYHWDPFAGFADVNNASGEDFNGGGTTTTTADDKCDEQDEQLCSFRRHARRRHYHF
jgi:RNA polymerase II subunit A-like phosphatase